MPEESLYNYSSAELIRMCREAGLSTEGSKRDLASRLISSKIPPSERILVGITRNELDILEGVVRHELGLITEEELKAIILKATSGKSSWEGGLNPLLTVLHYR